MVVQEHMPMMTGDGLLSPLFYAVTAIPHIIDVTSVTEILVVSYFILLFGMRDPEHMPMMTGDGLLFP